MLSLVGKLVSLDGIKNIQTARAPRSTISAAVFH